MNFLKPIILFFILAMSANSAFAVNKEDCYRIDSQTGVNQCANEIIQHSPFIGPMLNALLTKYSAPIGSWIANTTVRNSEDDQITLDYDESQTNLLTKGRDTFGDLIQAIFIFMGSGFALMVVYVTQFTGEFLGKKKHDFVYLAINYTAVFYLLGLGGLFHLLAGAVLGGTLILISFLVWFSNTFLYASEVDAGYQTTQAEAAARDNFDTFFEVAVRNDATALLLESKKAAIFDFGKVVNDKRYFVESAFTKCLAEPAEPSKFLATLIINGYQSKTQRCFSHTLGYKVLDFGSISYYGKEESTKAKLLEIMDIAHAVAYDSIRLMCGNALNVDDRRAKWALTDNANPMAFEQCLSRLADGSVNPADDGRIQFYPANNGVTQASIKAQIEQARKVWVQAATQFVANHAKDANAAKQKPLTTVESFIMGMSTINHTASDLNSLVNTEFTKNVKAVSSFEINGFGNMVGLSMDGDESQSGKEWESTKLEQVFNINATITALIRGTAKEESEKIMKNSVEYLSNMLLGDVFKTSGFSFQDCTQQINTCTAPVLNQSAALFENGLIMLEKYWGTYLITAIGQQGFKQSETQKNQAISRGFGLLRFVSGSAIAVCGVLLILGGLIVPMIFISRYGGVITGLAAELIKFAVRLFRLITLRPSNVHHERSNHTLLDLFLMVIWKVFEQSAILGTYIFSIAIHSIMSTIMGLTVWAICMPLMQNTNAIATFVSIIFMVLIFQYVNVHVQIKLAKAMLGILDSLEKQFKVKTIVDNTNNAINSYQEAASKFQEIARKIMH